MHSFFARQPIGVIFLLNEHVQAPYEHQARRDALQTIPGPRRSKRHEPVAARRPFLTPLPLLPIERHSWYNHFAAGLE